MIGSQIRANAASMEEITVEQFAFHPLSQLGRYPQAVRVFGDEERLHGIVASLNDAVFTPAGDASATESDQTTTSSTQ